jgi:L-alanine-DL-glutamate epimerase-like enolase superfamily enzyme
MKMERRNFLKGLGLLSGGMIMAQPGISNNKYLISKNAKMKLSFRPYELQLKHAFTLATSSRTTTPVMLVELEYDGLVGYGEASMPPYLGESHETVARFLQKVDLSGFNDPFRMDEILEYIDSIESGNRAAKACVDIALHDLVGKIIGQPWYKIWGLTPENTPNTSFTIGIDTRDVIIEKTKEAAEFKILKVKMGRDNDKELVEAIRSVTNVPLCVDVNQGWTDKHEALEMIHWLNEKGIVFVEQPMPKEQIDDMAWLTEHSPLPTIADEAFQRIHDIPKFKDVYTGINIKLMKSTGMHEAKKMIEVARALDMKVMIGCMTETSCAVSAAAQLSPLCEWADLDGNLLITNDIYEGVKVINGKVTLNELPGIGIKKL